MNMTTPAAQTLQAENALKDIMTGQTQKVINPEDRKYHMVENGKRVPNIILRMTVDKLKTKKIPEKVILDQILFFDELAEKGELLDYLNKQISKEK
jgi:hypothetical protein